MRTPFYSLVAVGLVLALGGCEKKPSAENAAVPLVPVDLRSAHFAAVNQHLELGGILYGYIDIDGDIARLGQTLTELTGQIAKIQPNAGMFKQDYAPLLTSLGLTDVKALGYSSVAVANGFRNRIFFYTPQGRHGLLAAVGGAPQPFVNTHYAPADADFFWEAELNFPEAYAAIKAVVAKIGGDTVVNLIETQLKAPSPAGPIPYDVIQQINGRFTALLRLNPQDHLRLPTGKTVLEVPGVSFFIRADGLGKALGPSLAALPPIRKTQNGERTFYEWPQAVFAGKLQPIFTIEKDALIIASDRAFLLECLERKNGLDQQPDFKGALANIGAEGNGLTYVNPKLFEKMRSTLVEFEQKNPESKVMIDAWLNKLPKTARPLVSVRSNQADGILIQAEWDTSLKEEALMFSATNPVTIGLLAAMAIPAFEKVRTNSQEQVIRNNLRQLSAAAQQFMLETGKKRATYADLVGTGEGKYIRMLKSAAGEDYSRIVISEGDTFISVRTPDGKVVTYHW